MDDIVHVADNMRPEDVAEIKASSGLAPLECLIVGVSISPYSQAIESNGKPIAILGLAFNGSSAGVPWMLGTPDIAKAKKSFLSASKSALNDMLKLSPALSNYVHSSNKKSISFLKCLGFDIGTPEPYGVAMEPFHKFSIGGVNV
jgi:hypothetical protein